MGWFIWQNILGVTSYIYIKSFKPWSGGDPKLSWFTRVDQTTSLLSDGASAGWSWWPSTWSTFRYRQCSRTWEGPSRRACSLPEIRIFLQQLLNPTCPLPVPRRTTPQSSPRSSTMRRTLSCSSTQLWKIRGREAKSLATLVVSSIMLWINTCEDCVYK